MKIHQLAVSSAFVLGVSSNGPHVAESFALTSSSSRLPRVLSTSTQQGDRSTAAFTASRLPLHMSSVTESVETVNGDGAENDEGFKREGSIWQVDSKEKHAQFLKEHSNELVVMKFFAPWCRACKGLAPKFRQVATDEKYQGLPVVFAEMDVTHNKDFIKALGVLALPGIHFYAGSDGLVENFPCGPSKVPILKRKLADFLNANVDRESMQLRLKSDSCDLSETEPCAETPVETTSERTVKVGDMVLSDEKLRFLRYDIPFFKDLTDDEFNGVLSRATLQEFEAGSVIMRQGMEGKLFYVIESGEVEISIKTAFEDPLTTPSTYLGAVMNILTKNNYFGERALITGEPRAASIRAIAPTRCFAFAQKDIPSTSVLSGRKAATKERLQEVDNKYGVDMFALDEIEMKAALTSSNVASQKRGSVNTPEIIPGVDTEEIQSNDMLGASARREDVLPLLIRFKLIRHAARCFEYIVNTQVQWGDAGETRRRSLLVSHLTAAQQEEFRDVFEMIDTSRDGTISILELKRAMESARCQPSSELEIAEMVNKANPLVNGNTEMTLEDFMGVMAEAEFYYLFLDTFNALDTHNTGFVKASDLDQVLCGMRDLISQDHMSIIDVEDKDMLVDYEQFSRMMLGANLK